MKQDRDKTGKFFSEAEPNSRNLTVRVPNTLHSQIKQVAGDQMAVWVREALAEKLARETQQSQA